MYRQFDIQNSTFCPHSVCMCFVWIWQQTAIMSLYSINWLVFINETECVYCAVRTGPVYIIRVNFSLWKVNPTFGLFCTNAKIKYFFPLILSTNNVATHKHYSNHVPCCSRNFQILSLAFRNNFNIEKINSCDNKVHPCTGTEALYRPYGP